MGVPVESFGSYCPGPGIFVFSWAFGFLLSSNKPFSSNFCLIVYLGPSPINVLYSYFPLPGVFDSILTHSLFWVPICHEGVLLDISQILYLPGPGVNNGSSLSCFTILNKNYMN